MLSYFKLNDPFRLVPLALLVFILKLPTLLNPVAYPETIHWFTIGEAMQTGAMYVDIWDGLAPFSATVYMVFTWLFGRSVLALLLLGASLTFFQALIINSFSIKAKLFENNSNIPALVYVLLTSTHPAFFSLSPPLMGLTFILLGLGKVLSHVEFRAKKDMHIIMIGLYFGSAGLFFLPYMVIMPIGIILLGLFSNTVLRRHFLLIFSSITPLVFAYFYYWIISNNQSYFINHFLNIGNYDAFYPSVGWQQGMITLCFPLFFLVIGLLTFGKQRRLTNYQNRTMQLFFVLGLLLASVLLFEKPISYYGLVFFVPIAAYFTTHFTSLFTKRIYKIILNVVLLLGPPSLLWGISNNLIPDSYRPAESVAFTNYNAFVKNQKIMVLGSAKDLYSEAQLAGPFYDWGYSKAFFSELDYYDNLVFLQKHLKKTPPQIIIDLDGSWKNIAKRLPQIADRYRQTNPNVWVLKE